MAYEMPDNSISIEVRPENIGQKFPVVDAKIKIDGRLIQTAVWGRSSRYGLTFTCGSAKSLLAFLRALLQTNGQEQPQNCKLPAAHNYASVEDDVDNW